MKEKHLEKQNKNTQTNKKQTSLLQDMSHNVLSICVRYDVQVCLVLVQ